MIKLSDVSNNILSVTWCQEPHKAYIEIMYFLTWVAYFESIVQIKTIGVSVVIEHVQNNSKSKNTAMLWLNASKERYKCSKISMKLQWKFKNIKNIYIS